jgi:putative ABC transport system permease protein
LQVGMFNTISWQELIIIPGLIILAVLAGIVPAMAAYRTDVSKNLAN